MISKTDRLSAAVTKDSPRASTLIHLLRERAQRQPDHAGYTFLVDGEQSEESISYEMLDRKARNVASHLQALGAGGGRVLLLYPPGIDYIVAFFGCLYAGAIAVPAYPPGRHQGLQRLQAVVADARPGVALTNAAILLKAGAMSEASPQLQAARWLATDNLAADLSEQWVEPADIADTSIAFLQYTSGSTATPKGVMVSHRNLLHNQGLIRQAFRQTAESVIVGWLPLYHDMGLIGNVLQPLFLGAKCILMSPLMFLQSPVRWLSAITKYRATTSGGPNFAYDLCVRRITEEQRAQLDLTSWSVAFNGAEPVRADTLARFSQSFASCGFRKAAFHPCYGLAEATLLVCAKPYTDAGVVGYFDGNALKGGQAGVVAEAQDGVPLVSCGGNLPGQEIAIVDPETRRRCAPNQIGEIWLAGDSVTHGYWSLPDESDRVFNAFIIDTEAGTGEGPYLRTGDLGFQHEGELFVTGRLKDLIIIRGLNHYPQDIECTVENSHEALRPGAGAAFSLDTPDGERLVIVQEAQTRRLADAAAIFEKIRRAVALAHEIQPYAITLLRPGAIAKTSSGKIQRKVCREQFLNRSLQAVAEWQDAGTAYGEVGGEGEQGVASPLLALSPLADEAQIQQWLVEQLAVRLGVSRCEVDINSSITRYGLDSLAAIELAHALESGLGLTLPISNFLADLSIAQLSARLHSQPRREKMPRALPASADAQGETQALSYGQRALWFLHQYAPESSAYNIATSLRVSGCLYPAALRRAFQSLVDRHPGLRTTFTTLGGEPVRQVRQQVEVALTEENASRWTEDAVHQYLLEASQRPFDLERGPLLRVYLLARAPEEHILLITIHHIVCDLWSLALLMRELEQFYDAERGGRTVELKALDFSYGDYVRWQQETLSGEVGERLREYWQRQLAGELPQLDLPYGKARPTTVTARAESRLLVLDEQLTEALVALSRSQSATLYMTLLAAFQVLLYRYTGQKEFLIGTPTSGRNLPEWDAVVGYFVNPVVLRVRVSPDATFAQHLRQAQATALAAFEHQEYPFALLVEELAEQMEMARELARPERLQVMFAFQKSQVYEKNGLAALALPGNADTCLTMGDLRLEALPLRQQAGQFELTMMVAQDGGKLVASLQYNRDLFDGALVGRLLAHYGTLLAELVARPSERLSRLSLLTPAERQQLCKWNETANDFPAAACVQEQFEAQARKTPRAVAVADGRETLTYEELNRRANQFARRLRRYSVGAETAVALCMGRSVEIVVAALGALKAGGFYVPIDPLYPKERIAFMLEDSGARVLVTTPGLAEAFSESRARVITLDVRQAPDQEDHEEGDDDLAVAVRADNLAYMIYTSGSTGMPKGVAVAHGGLTNLVAWHKQTYGVDPNDRATQIASPAFDAAVWELWPYLTAGASLHIPDDTARLSAHDLCKWLASERITICFLPTPLAEAMLGEDALPEDLALRVLLVGGDKLHRAPAKPLPFALVNHYGPTENSVVATSAPVTASELPAAPPIGRPIANTHTYILDSQLQPLPVAVAGEIYIGGAGLARGYQQRPDLTAERFIPDPFSAAPGARMYKTGDLGRFLPDGQIEFLGRVDFQVKINGFRIEVGEIEAALAAHPALREVVVVAREVAKEAVAEETAEARTKGASSTRRYLAAYCVPASGQDVEASGLRAYLKDKLPEPMVPAAFVFLEHLPLTPNGKLDRAGLPEPIDMGSEAQGAGVSHASVTEELLIGVWQRLLEVKSVNSHDNFFQLGGHSLLAAQLASRVRELFQVELPLRTLFESPTLAELAQRVEQLRQSGHGKPLPPLLAITRQGDLPLSSAQERLWFLDHLEPDNPAYNIPAAIRLSGALCLKALEASLNEIVGRHEALRTTFVSRQGKPLQVIAPTLRLRLHVADLSSLPEAQRERQTRLLAEEEARTPFRLATGPLIRARLMRLAAQEHVLLLTLHHIVFDGLSARIFFDELRALYAAYVTAETPQLAAPEIQYADVAHWQKRLLEDGALRDEMAYWRGKLTPPPPGVELPTDRPRPARQTFNGRTMSFELASPMQESLEALCSREGITLFMLLLAVFKLLLYRYSGQPDLTVGTPVAGRQGLQTERVIGLFTNVLVLRTDLSGNPRFRELLGRVRETALDAFGHQHVPFERLVEEIYTDRDLSRTPLFQTMFSMLKAPDKALELHGLTVEVLDVPQTTAKFDLLLSVEETGGRLKHRLEYNTDLFDAPTIARLAGHYRHLLQEVVTDPDRRINDLPLLDEAERHEILTLWNDTGRGASDALLVHEMFERQAADTPNRVAIQAGSQALTYQELQQRSEQLAEHLRSLGVGAGVLVALFMNRSADLVIGLLGVLKAGGAYVPLDPSYPPERLAFMLNDAQVPVVLTQRQLRESLPYDRGTVVCMDAAWQTAAVEGAAPRPTLAAEELAYVIYTSGSTGKPKGVQITHRSVANFLSAMQERLRLTERDALLAVTTLSFDIAVLELLLPLTTGCRIVLVSSEEAADGAKLKERLMTSGATLMQATPATWRMLVDAGWEGSADLKIVCGGEALPLDLATRLATRSGAMWNLYGPTETTVWSLLWEVPPTTSVVLIGKPIANTEVYLLDRNLEPVPVGAPGHLYLGGAGLARGYLGRPELTAERFIPNPFGVRAGDRLYDTGDVARFRADGNVEFLGRADQQVKLRGFRIELGEIEAVLNQHPDLQNAIVVAHGASLGEKQLVAYVISRAGATPTARELRRHLGARLPEYMIPATYLFLEQYPLTPNGKIDRKALPAPDGRRGVDADYVAPRTPTEQTLTQIWREVIGLKQVGVFDNFFELGGHSLSATQIIARLNESFHVEIPLRALFENPSIAALAEQVEAAGIGAVAASAPAIVPRSREAYRVKPSPARPQSPQLEDNETVTTS